MLCLEQKRARKFKEKSALSTTPPPSFTFLRTNAKATEKARQAALMDSDEEDLAAAQRCPNCFSELRSGASKCLSCGFEVAASSGASAAASPPPPATIRSTNSTPTSPNLGVSPIPVRSASGSVRATPDPAILPTVSAVETAPAMPTRATVDDEVIGEEELAKIMQVCTEIQNSLVFSKTGKDAVDFFDLTKPPRRFLKSGDLTKKGTHALLKRNTTRTIFLFKDVIVVTHLPDIRGKRKVTAVLRLPICELQDLFAEPGADVCSFQITDPSSRSVTFVAKSTKEKRQWLFDLSEAIMAHMDPYETGAHIGFAHTLVRGSVFEAAVKGLRDRMAHFLTLKMCEPNQKDLTGRCPIHYVVELEHAAVLRIMLLAGKSGKNVDLSAVDGDGRRALDIAIDKLSVELLDEFFRAGMGVVMGSLERAMKVFADCPEVSSPTVVDRFSLPVNEFCVFPLLLCAFCRSLTPSWSS